MKLTFKLLALMFIVVLMIVAIRTGWLEHLRFLFSAQNGKEYIFKFNSGQASVLSIPGVIKGKQYNVIIDTGSDFSGIRGKVPGNRTGEKLFATDNNGRKYKHHVYSIDTVVLGSLNIIDHPFAELGSKNPFGDGIIGMDILKNFALTIDFPKQEIKLTPAGSILDLSKMDGIAFDLHNRLPIISLKINNINYNFLIDTGFDEFADITTNLDSAAIPTGLFNWRGYDESVNYLGVKDVSKHIKYAKRIADVRFMDRDLRDEIITYSNRKSQYHLLGIDFFKRFGKVTFDFRNNRLYVGALTKKSLLHYMVSQRFFNDIGIVFNNDSLPKITQIADRMDSRSLHLGDTIVGFENIKLIENNGARNIKLLPHIYQLDKGTQRSKYIQLVRHARFSNSDARIAIFKNGSISYINLKRRRLLKIQDEYLDYVEQTNLLNTPYMMAKGFVSDTSAFIIYKPLSQ